MFVRREHSTEILKIDFSKINEKDPLLISEYKSKRFANFSVG